MTYDNRKVLFMAFAENKYKRTVTRTNCGERATQVEDADFFLFILTDYDLVLLVRPY